MAELILKVEKKNEKNAPSAAPTNRYVVTFGEFLGGGRGVDVATKWGCFGDHFRATLRLR